MNVNQLPVVIKRQIATAKMPLNYEVAKKAIRECVRVDECKEWDDRAAAIASYAKQVKDRSLQDMANRIRLRAVAQIGELLLELPIPRMRRNPGYRAGFSRDTGGRTHVARVAGITKGKATEAMRIARVPRAERERLIEASPPARPGDIADLAVSLHPRFGSHFVAGRAYCEIVGSGRHGLAPFASWTDRTSVVRIAPSCTTDEAKRIRVLIIKVQEWLDDLDQHLPKEKK